MVIVNVIGGLGNQLFQYAAGRAVAAHKNTGLKLDISEFQAYPLRTYRLSAFNIVENLATAAEIQRYAVKPGLDELRRRIVQRLLPYYRWPVFYERSLAKADLNIFKVRKEVYLHGYWQSELYFADIADTIRREFTVKAPPDEQNLAMLDRIGQTNSVNVHVRRGDYISNSKATQVHGTPGLDYYKAAIDIISARVATPHFFVFSDDMDWVRENLPLPSPTTYVDHNGPERDHEDLRLMSHCKHHIIANSSFSWWGAWLARFPGKEIVAPRRWFAAFDVDVASRFPKGWHLL